MTHSAALSLDLIDYGDLFFKAMESSGKKFLTKVQWLSAVEKVFKDNLIPWDGTPGDGNRAMTSNLFDDIAKTKTNDPNNLNKADNLVSRRELFRAIFNIFDTSGDGRLNNTEVKTFFENYPKHYNRKLHADWWTKEIEPLVQKIENGISQRELKAYLAKAHSYIWDLRHWVIELTKPKGGKKEDYHAYEDVKPKKK